MIRNLVFTWTASSYVFQLLSIELTELSSGFSHFRVLLREAGRLPNARHQVSRWLIQSKT
jgi:hypothetical protein